MAMGDFNGDGKADIMTAYRYGDYNTSFHAFLSTGSAFNYGANWFSSTGYGLSYVIHFEAGDFNGDGKDDIATAYQLGSCNTAIHRFVSTGSGLTYEGAKWQSTGYCLYAAKYMMAGYYNSTAYPKLADDYGETLLPSEFTLSQNYPNPFNPVTTISYSLPEATHVKVEVFNILGQRVETLLDANQPAGEHTITWDASHYSSGIYFYRLQTEDAVETRKMLLLK